MWATLISPGVGVAAADEAGVGDGVVRGAKRAGGDKGMRGVEEQAADAVDLGGLDGFLQRHRRDDRGDAFGDHGFSRAGRADEERVVIAGDGDLDGALDVVLAAHVGKIHIVVLMPREKLGDVFAHRRERFFAGEKLERLAQIRHAIHFDALDHGRLARILHRHDDRLSPAPPRLQRDRQHAADGPHAPGQCEFADEAELLNVRQIDLRTDGDHRERDGQVETRSLFFHIGRREIDRRPPARPMIAAV